MPCSSSPTVDARVDAPTRCDGWPAPCARRRRGRCRRRRRRRVRSAGRAASSPRPRRTADRRPSPTGSTTRRTSCRSGLRHSPMPRMPASALVDASKGGSSSAKRSRSRSHCRTISDWIRNSSLVPNVGGSSAGPRTTGGGSGGGFSRHGSGTQGGRRHDRIERDRADLRVRDREQADLGDRLERAQAPPLHGDRVRAVGGSDRRADEVVDRERREPVAPARQLAARPPGRRRGRGCQ